MMFGALKQKRGPFDMSPNVLTTPGIGDGLPGAQPMGDPGLGMPMAAPAPVQAGDKVNWIGVLGDALAGAIGQPGQYAAQRQRDREIQRQEQQYQRRQNDAFNMWRMQQEYERANPAPRAPHYWEMNDGSLGVVGPDGKPQVLYKDPTPKIDWITANNPDGTKTLVSVQKGGGQTSGGPAIGTVEDGYRFRGGDPSKQESWERVGGPSQPATGGFR